MNQSNLPNLNLDNADINSKLFNRQFANQISYKTSEVDAVIGYFLKRDFERVSAVNTALVILEQASIDKISASELIDTLKGLNDVQLSNVVAQILNLNRPKSTRIGYRIKPTTELFDQRNILP
jgi:transcription termination factor NusB